MSTLTFVGISGSLRRASRNSGLLRCCAAHLPEGVRMEIADIAALPFYNEDIEKPQAAKDLIAQVAAADALVLACPEYNYSLAPALKNALDWLSREPNLAPLNGKAACLLGAGGAGAAIAFALAEAGVRRLTIVNRSQEKARDLARRAPS